MEKTDHYKIFNDIKNGFSREVIDNNTLYFKHLSISDNFDCINAYDIYKQEAIDLGLQTESEKIKNAIAGGWWKKENEERIALLNQTIANLKKTKEKLLYSSQKKQIDDQIKNNEGVLLTFLKSRNEIIDYTAERYASFKYNDFILKNFIFKDEKLTTKFFLDDESYSCYTDDFLNELKSCINKHELYFNIDSIKRLAATGFFQNMVFISDSSCTDFWGKPVIQCSQRQNDLLMYGKIYRAFIKNQAENGKQVPEDIMNDPDKFVNFVDNFNYKDGTSKFKFGGKNKTGSDKNRVSSYVGATGEDLKDMGVKVEKVQGKSLLQLANESGGIIEKSDYLSAREK